MLRKMKEGTFRLFENQYEAFALFNFSTFRLFEIENETLPLFDFSTFWFFSTFRNSIWSLSTFQLFDFWKFFLHWHTFRLNHAAYFSNPEEFPPTLGEKPWTNRWIPVDFSHLPMGWGSTAAASHGWIWCGSVSAVHCACARPVLLIGDWWFDVYFTN